MMHALVHADELRRIFDKLEHVSQVIQHTRSNSIHDENCHIATIKSMLTSIELELSCTILELNSNDQRDIIF